MAGHNVGCVAKHLTPVFEYRLSIAVPDGWPADDICHDMAAGLLKLAQRL